MSANPYLSSVDDGFRMRSSGQWAAEKLFYLRNYIDIFETSMRMKWPNRNFIDLFSGPGKNFINPSKEIQLGSPLIALTTRFPFTGYYFSDIDINKAEALKIRCSFSPHFDRVKIYTENANRIVSSIVGNIRQFSPNSLNLAFLDPEGLELSS
jgi:three-Cys-motif partner protein